MKEFVDEEECTLQKRARKSNYEKPQSDFEFVLEVG